MAYTADNVGMEFNSPGGGLPRIFVYKNATPDSDATIVTAGYFSNGVTLGMRVSDLVHIVNPTTAKYKLYQVASVSGTAATVAAPTAIT